MNIFLSFKECDIDDFDQKKKKKLIVAIILLIYFIYLFSEIQNKLITVQVLHHFNVKI